MATNPEKCYFCNKKSRVFKTEFLVRVCNKDLNKCKGYKAFLRHVAKCPECLETYNSIFLPKHKIKIQRYSCNRLKYIRGAIKRYRIERYRNYKFKFQLARGDFKCYVCGEPAKYHLWSRGTCCQDQPKKCPNYKEWFSNYRKKLYETNMIYRKRMSEAMLKVHNRENVRESKRLKMIHLHNDDCEPCKEFQAKYKAAHKARRGENYERNLGYIQTWKQKRGE